VELQHLRVVLALSEELHFGRAAARLHVVQSAVSQALKDLEVELGVSLFDRSPRGVTITAAGIHFRDHALRAMEEIASGASAAQRAARGEEGRLRVAFSAMATSTALPRVVTRFMREAPNVQVELENTSSPGVVEAIARREADVGIVPEIRRYGSLSFFELQRERLHLPRFSNVGRARDPSPRWRWTCPDPTRSKSAPANMPRRALLPEQIGRVGKPTRGCRPADTP